MMAFKSGPFKVYVMHHMSSAAVSERPCFGVCQDKHWDQPYVQGTGQPHVVCESSQSVAWAALQGLTCEKKTKSILVKEADLYRNEKMT